MSSMADTKTSSIPTKSAVGSPVIQETKKIQIDKSHQTSIQKDDSQKKEEPKNPNEIFVVGIMFADQQRYVDSLYAQATTWLPAFPKERVFAVGPVDAIKDKSKFPRLIQTPCPDRELYCKRMKQISEAYKLLKDGIHFDWLLSGNEDWFVNPPAMRKALEGKDPKKAVVYSNLGCSQEWKYHANSKGGTVPKPEHYPEPVGCDGLRKRGGLCLGDGGVISRAAVEIMMENGEEGLFNLTRSQPFEWKHHPQDDPVLSCVVYALEDKGVKLESKPWKSNPHHRQDDVVIFDEDSATEHAVVRKAIGAAEIIRKAQISLDSKKANSS